MLSSVPLQAEGSMLLSIGCLQGLSHKVQAGYLAANGGQLSMISHSKITTLLGVALQLPQATLSCRIYFSLFLCLSVLLPAIIFSVLLCNCV